MAVASFENEKDPIRSAVEAENDDYDEEEDDEDDDDDEEEPEIEILLRRLSRRRVHELQIKGNSKTIDSAIEAELEVLKSASTVQELLEAATIANARLQQLGVFDSVKITLDSGPPELPGTANVVVEVAEIENSDIDSKSEVGRWWLDISLKLKNLAGYGDLCGGSFSFCGTETSEASFGFFLPRFRELNTPGATRLSLLPKDGFKFSSCDDQTIGLSVGLFSSINHKLAYNMSWRPMRPSQTPGDDLLSALKYKFRVDKRNSSWRPTRGYAFVSTSQFGGLVPYSQSLYFLCQEFDFRYALPLGFQNAALNIGVSAGAVYPWGTAPINMPLYLREKFFLGGRSSPAYSLGGPMSVSGFKPTGPGPDEIQKPEGGDLAVSAFLDLSFDLPLKRFTEAGIHGHAFALAGNFNKLTENSFRDLSFLKFREPYRASAGFGIVIPLKRFRIEVNYCQILKQQEQDGGKTGLQISFSSYR